MQEIMAISKLYTSHIDIKSARDYFVKMKIGICFHKEY